MLDHLLPLIYREFEYFDEANKENFGYCTRRRARRFQSHTQASTRNLDGGNEEQRDAKKQHIRGIPKDDEAIAKKKQVKQETLAVKQKVKEKQRHMELVIPIKKMQESKTSALKTAKKIKMSKKNKQTKHRERFVAGLSTSVAIRFL
ncbi:unnamed protein product [Peronospora destructor]|uniref:Uncharacterized protein n=1 Tax=Peronospora destructor TaxID=86335 RepID=A0AAV0TGG2_9STRA|nr:unnamed protein product [Peronospora destructor]